MPSGAPVRPLPLGFFVCGLVSLCFSGAMLLMALSVLFTPARPGPGELELSGLETIAVRGMSMVLLSLGVVVTEALWDGRPHAYPASVALASTYAAVMLVVVVAESWDGLATAVALVLSAVVVMPMLRYLRTRSRQLWPHAGVRVPAARP